MKPSLAEWIKSLDEGVPDSADPDSIPISDFFVI